MTLAPPLRLLRRPTPLAAPLWLCRRHSESSYRKHYTRFAEPQNDLLQRTLSPRRMFPLCGNPLGVTYPYLCSRHRRLPRTFGYSRLPDRNLLPALGSRGFRRFARHAQGIRTGILLMGLGRCRLLPDQAGVDCPRFTRGRCADGEAIGWHAGGAVSRPVSADRGMPEAATREASGKACARAATHQTQERLEQKLQYARRAADLESGASVGLSTEQKRMSPGAGVARNQAAPMTGRPAAPPAGQPGCLMALANLRRWFRNQLPCRGSIAEDPRVRLLRHAESIASMWGFRPSLSRTGGLPPTGSNPSFRKRREERFLPIVAMSSGRLFLDRGARQHCPSPLHRPAQTNVTFFPACQKGTFLLCLDTRRRVG